MIREKYIRASVTVLAGATAVAGVRVAARVTVKQSETERKMMRPATYVTFVSYSGPFL